MSFPSASPGWRNAWPSSQPADRARSGL